MFIFYYIVKGNALTAATASVGLVTMWEPDNGSEEINKFIDVKDGYMKEVTFYIIIMIYIYKIKNFTNECVSK